METSENLTCERAGTRLRAHLLLPRDQADQRQCSLILDVAVLKRSIVDFYFQKFL